MTMYFENGSMINTVNTKSKAVRSNRASKFVNINNYLVQEDLLEELNFGTEE